jgi:TRAP-type C4-dicarboxylate transport system permease small subunit
MDYNEEIMHMANIAAEPFRKSYRLETLWKRLDQLYLYCGYLAAFFMVCIFVVTMLQIIGRLVGINPRGLTDYAGYFMAASAFLAFAHTLNRGSHIRIELFLSMMGPFRPGVEKLSFVLSTLIGVWFSYYCWSMVYWSYKLGDMSQGLDATPIWIPQLSMAIGISLLALSVTDHSLRFLLTGEHQIPVAPDAL